MATPAQIAANQANAKKSTGPATPAGKAKSSLNALSHGFEAATSFIPGEDPEDAYGLLADLNHEFQPATPTEQILVEKMFHNHWLSLRAIRLQSNALRFRMEQFHGETPKDLGLLIRYQTAADRAFHRAHAELLKVQKERKNSEIGFVPESAEEVAQSPVNAAPEPVSVRQNVRQNPVPIPEISAEWDAFTVEMAARLGITVEEFTRAA